jgi:hypothetical protein
VGGDRCNWVVERAGQWTCWHGGVLSNAVSIVDVFNAVRSCAVLS